LIEIRRAYRKKSQEYVNRLIEYIALF